MKRRLLILAGLTLVLLVAQAPSTGRMEDEGAGVIRMEFVATGERADSMLAEWGDRGRDAAREQLYIDYPFLIAYGLFLFFACTAVSRRAPSGGKRRAGELLAIAGLAGAGFDALENASLLMVLGDHTGQPWPALATGFAVVKFALTTPAWLYALIGWLSFRSPIRGRSA